MTDFSELFARVDLALGKKPDYLNVSRFFFSYSILAPVGFVRTGREIHVYVDEDPFLPHSLVLVEPTVLHSHSRDYNSCPAPAFCHVYGYKPTGTENPTFITLFNSKWKDFYK